MKLPKYYLKIKYATGAGYRSRIIRDKYNYLNKIVAERALKEKIAIFQKNGYVLSCGNENSVMMYSAKQSLRAYISVEQEIVEV